MLAQQGCCKHIQCLNAAYKLERTMADNTTDINPVELATELTMAWLGNPNTRTSADDVPAFLNKMFETVSALVRGGREPASTEADVTDYTGAVTARKSLANPDFIISMIDGKPYRTLRRHLSSNGLTPEQYRERYNLKADYPIVAPSYSEARRTMAKSIGLGRKPGQTTTPNAEAKPAPRKRKAEPEAE
jgi:predicted transcriptional regulator